MAAVAYSPDAYNSLPSLRAASGQLKELDGESVVSGPIRQLFVSHGVHKRFGVVLLHKHLDIGPTERLVEYGHTSIPWEVGDTTSYVIDKYEGTIFPRSFRLMEGNFVPYEFGYFHERPHPVFLGERDSQFLKEFGSFLAEHQLDGVLGLRDLDQRDSKLNVEVTEGKANIMMPRGSVPESELIPAVWIFGLDDDDRCHCREYCYRDSKGNHTGSDHGCG
ncbi:hypothetical protein MYCTH_78828 [Thermothelomyces thermophilus ATCC 42464]|uniref:Uncharacterized protein n=1 Tax=Thermothelomyces thermophilus (strain ATCC 42464 / BCRC 31852 / DSM 1799) TaxID=573729 RepID=G2QAB2_THET4|nr:uncharacterized protein MYCTH_78828 [Thermothelomyces thermophilus ATCC 42464]AEO56662.1 hypothetical protein MYCTH_78828 [Thermothelomyces thermophilus ATCC 42464]